MRVGINVEQLLSPSPGGIGRYSGQLAMLLATVAPTDDVVPFVARHPRPAVEAARRAAGLVGAPVVLPLPRPLLYEAWVRWGQPPLPLGAPALAAVDLVHAPSVAVPPLGRSPLVVTAHDAASEVCPDAFTARGRAFHRRGLAAAARRADLVITVSQAAADEIVAHSRIPAERMRVVPNAVDPPAPDEEADTALRRRLGLSGPYVLWIGSLEPRKGVGTVVAAMGRRARAGARPRVPLVLAGYRGWLGEGIVTADDRRALGGDLVELGPLDEATLWAVYRGAEVFAFPSRHEGFGLPPLEAMSQGVPVVASDLPACREVLGDAAVLVAPGDVAAWADALDGLLADEADRRSRARAGRVRAAVYTPERLVSGTRAVYREVSGG